MSLSERVVWAAAVEVALLLTAGSSVAAPDWTTKLAGPPTFRLQGSVIVSPRNRWVAAGGQPEGIHIWRFDDGRLLRVLQSEVPHPAMVAMPDGRNLVAEVKPGVLQVVNAETARVVRTINGAGPLEVSRDGRRLIGRTTEGAPAMWELATGKAVDVHALDSARPVSSNTPERASGSTLAAVLPDARHILVYRSRLADHFERGVGDVIKSEVGYEETLTVQEIPGGRLLRSAALGIRVARPMEARRLTVSVAADGNRVLVQTPGGAVLRWNLAEGAAPRALGGVVRPENVHILPDGERALVWNETGISLLDLRSMTPAWIVEPAGRISIVRVSGRGAMFAFGTERGAINVGDMKTGGVQAVESLEQTKDVAIALAFSSDDHALLVATAWGGIGRWPLAKALARLKKA